MKKILILLTLFNSTLFSFNKEAFKKAIAEIETGDVVNWSEGRSGEKTQYQFIKTTWEQYSDFSFDKLEWYDSKSIKETELVMNAHVDRMLRVFKNSKFKNEKALKVFSLALIHNSGEGSFKRLEFKDRHLDYATRVNNLYDLYLNKY